MNTCRDNGSLLSATCPKNIEKKQIIIPSIDQQYLVG
jgi:hypothetical protein